VRLLLKLSDRACDRLRSRPRPARPQLSARWACIAFEPIVCTGRRGAIGLRAPPGMTTRR
jgi:hypothetical protein